MTSGRPNSVSLAIRMLWSTWSNALAKSIKTARTDWPSSTALYHWCIMSTSAWVVERPFSAPYGRTSSLSLILSRIHVSTNDSSSLFYVAFSEIGLKSFSITWGGLALGTGITLASFQQVDTVPSRTDALKIAHTGPESWVQKFGRPSGLSALYTLIWLSFLSTTDSSMTNSLCKTSEVGGIVESDSGRRSAATC